ncbi:MAG: hypothetical protein DRJ50_14395, partial [Actinobacteria bacterium]
IGTGDGYHIYMARDGGVYVYDGGRVHPVAEHARYITEKQMNFARADEVFGVLDKVRNLAFFYYPSLSGGSNMGIVVDVKSGSVWPMSISGAHRNYSCGLEVNFRYEPRIGDVNIPFGSMGLQTIGGLDSTNKMIAIGFTDDKWGANDWDGWVDEYSDFNEGIDFGWSTGYTPLGTPPHLFKTVQEAYHTFSELEQIGMQLKWADRRLYEVYGPSRLMTMEKKKTSHRSTGRLFAMQFKGSSASSKFVYEGSTLSYRKRGQR